MALALTDFEGMCGFRPFDEIRDFVKGKFIFCQKESRNMSKTINYQ